jgi:predicted nucleotidyltransferase
VIVEEAKRARLSDFLDSRGTTVERVLETIETSLGPPIAVVATGSVLDGYGNATSDIDVNVVVDAETVRVVPIPAFQNELLVDTKYFTLAQLCEWVEELRDVPWPPRRLTREGYHRRYLQLLQCVRFGTGLVVQADDRARDVLDALREPWLAERVVDWWQAESVRCSLASRWLADVKPLVAAQKRCDALLAALEVRAASAGRLTFKPKWLSEKLRAVGDDDALQTLRVVLRVPVRVEEVADYLRRSTGLVPEPDGEGLAAQLWYAPGVTVRPRKGATLVSRWQLRTLEVRGPALPPVECDEPLWEGAIASDSPPELRDLFVEDMTWLSIVTGSR